MLIVLLASMIGAWLVYAATHSVLGRRESTQYLALAFGILGPPVWVGAALWPLSVRDVLAALATLYLVVLLDKVLVLIDAVIDSLRVAVVARARPRTPRLPTL